MSFVVTLIAPGLRVDYELSVEHLNVVWQALEDARKLDDAKEKLAEAVTKREEA